MSLEIYAKHIAEKGRGPDDTLVHMSRDEVKSLNDLAMAHGGQLTINPQTGLPEAGFLSAILPMVAGAALTGLSGGAINPLTAGMLVGGGSYLMNPKAGLMGGLMAGMGAYGGAGLGEALAQQGMEQAAGQKMLEGQVAENTAKMGTNLTPEALAKTGLQPGQYGYGLSGEMAGGDMMTKLTGPQYGAGMSTADLNAGLANQSITERLGTMGQGVKSLGTEGGFSNLYNRMGGGMGVAKTALTAAAPLATLQKDTSVAPVVDKDMGQRFSYSPGAAQPLPAPDVPTYEDMLTKQGNFGKQQNYYPNQGYTPISNDAAKDLYHFAGGGPVEQMSNNNAIGANTGFPQAYLHNNAYATPYQTPVSQNVLTGPGDVGVDPYTGEQKMAGGGISGSGNLDLSIPLDFGGAGGGGGFGGAGVNGYSAVGSGGGSQTGFTGQNNTAIGAKGDNFSDAARDPSYQQIQQLNGRTPFDNTIEGDTFQPQGTRAFGGNPQQMIGLLSSLMQGKQTGNASAQQPMQMATGGISDAGYNLGGYSDGGRLLRGPGDGVSDSIPAVIGKKQPARLADGEFVVPARIVSEIGNGSTEAGARKLYGMMDRVQAARRQTVGKGRVAKNSRADRYLPA
jgi:hypothetical protein